MLSFFQQKRVHNSPEKDAFLCLFDQSKLLLFCPWTAIVFFFLTAHFSKQFAPPQTQKLTKMYMHLVSGENKFLSRC